MSLDKTLEIFKRIDQDSRERELRLEESITLQETQKSLISNYRKAPPYIQAEMKRLGMVR